jgi:hypothetical protein
MSSKNNPDVRKAKQGAASEAPPMRRMKICIKCDGSITHAKDQKMVMVANGGKRLMQAEHKECPK